MKPNSFFPVVFRQHGHAFTLIELLIVVAIIAILASIAVPNFLEAQVRSKTARAKADMRSIATAIESYRVDYNTYPYLCTDVMSLTAFNNDASVIAGTVCGYLNYQKGGDMYTGGYAQTYKFYWGTSLTTPIAYMSSLPLDPFNVKEGSQFQGGKTGYFFACISTAVKMANAFPAQWALNSIRIKPDVPYDGLVTLVDPWPWTPVQSGSGGKKGTTYYASWLLSSVGPCGVPLDSSLFFCDVRYYELAHKDVTHGVGYYAATPGTDVNSKIYAYQPPYDPTNGTTTVGKIFRSSAGQLN